MNLIWVRFTLLLKKPLKSFASFWSPRLIGRLRSLLVYRFVKDLDFSGCTYVGTGYKSRPQMWQAALDKLGIQADTEITYYEFGVYNGDSLKWWGERNTNPASTFYGFDSFEGLPEDWTPGRAVAGTYKTKPGVLDNLDSRISLVPGWFNKSVPSFFSDHRVPDSSFKVIMFDADLFSSTVAAMAGVIMNISSTDQLWIFDEFVPEEARAFEIFLSGFDFTAIPIASDDRKYHVAFHINRPELTITTK